jgi:hypothetical protein
MTLKEFNLLKVGDRCFLKSYNKTFTSTEVLKIDRMFKKIVVLLRNKPVSYRYIPLKLKPNQIQSGMVGTYKI